MNYKAYAKSITTPNRKTRKGLRNSVFIANKKMSKVQRKAARLERKSLQVE